MDRESPVNDYGALSSVDLLALHRRGDPAVNDDALWRDLVTDLSPQVAEWAESIEAIDEVQRVFLALWRWRTTDAPWPFWMRLYTEIVILGEMPPSIQRFLDLKNEVWPDVWLPYWQEIADALADTPLLWALLLVTNNLPALIVFTATAADAVLQALPQVGELLSFVMFDRSANAAGRRKQLVRLINFSGLLGLRTKQRINAEMTKAQSIGDIIDIVWRYARISEGTVLEQYTAAVERLRPTKEEKQQAAIAYVRAALLAVEDRALAPPLSEELRAAMVQFDFETIDAILEEETYNPEDLIYEARQMNAKQAEKYLREKFEPGYRDRRIEVEEDRLARERLQDECDEYNNCGFGSDSDNPYI